MSVDVKERRRKKKCAEHYIFLYAQPSLSSTHTTYRSFHDLAMCECLPFVVLVVLVENAFGKVIAVSWGCYCPVANTDELTG